MTQVKEITAILEAFAPLNLQEDYDNAGLVCGDPEAAISSALLSTDITEEVVDEAIAGGHGLVIAHHPLIFRGLKNLLPDNYVKRTLLKAIRHGISLYSAHTNMDAVENGVSGRMADKLGLEKRRVLQPAGKLYSLAFYTPAAEAEKVRRAVLETGGGHIGQYSHCSFNTPGEGTFKALEGAHPYVGEINALHTEAEIKTEITVPDYLLQACIRALVAAHPYEEPVWNAIPLHNGNPVTGFGVIGELPQPEESHRFLERVKATFGCGYLRYTALCKTHIQKVAVCGGAGAFLTQAALRAGADVFVSADYKYHDFFDADKRLIIADIGHYESEQFTKEIFYELVRKKIPNFVVRFSEVSTNPVNYL